MIYDHSKPHNFSDEPSTKLDEPIAMAIAVTMSQI